MEVRIVIQVEAMEVEVMEAQRVIKVETMERYLIKKIGVNTVQEEKFVEISRNFFFPLNSQ